MTLLDAVKILRGFATSALAADLAPQVAWQTEPLKQAAIVVSDAINQIEMTVMKKNSFTVAHDLMKQMGLFPIVTITETSLHEHMEEKLNHVFANTPTDEQIAYAIEGAIEEAKDEETIWTLYDEIVDRAVAALITQVGAASAGAGKSVQKPVEIVHSPEGLL